MKRINLTAMGLMRGADRVCMARTAETADEIATLLAFDSPPGLGEIAARSRRLAEIAFQSGATEAVISGEPSPWMLEALPAALRMRGIQPLYVFAHYDSDGLRSFGGFVRT